MGQRFDPFPCAATPHRIEGVDKLARTRSGLKSRARLPRSAVPKGVFRAQSWLTIATTGAKSCAGGTDVCPNPRPEQPAVEWEPARPSLPGEPRDRLAYNRNSRRADPRRRFQGASGGKTEGRPWRTLGERAPLPCPPGARLQLATASEVLPALRARPFGAIGSRNAAAPAGWCCLWAWALL